MSNPYVLPNDFEEFAKYLPSGAMVAQADRLENLLKIRVIDLKREGVLSDHQSRKITVTQFGEVVAVVELRASNDFLTLRNPALGSAAQHISLAHTPCHFGGHRAWFLCPECDRRVGVLYYQGQFHCRHCTDLHYESQYKSESSRLFAKARMIRRKLGGSENMTEPFPERPKGMHFTTYLEQAAEYFRCSGKAFQSFDTKVL